MTSDIHTLYHQRRSLRMCKPIGNHFPGSILLLFLLLPIASHSQIPMEDSLRAVVAKADAGNDHRIALAEFQTAHAENQKASISTGTPASGSLTNGKLIPFSGPNFRYYDTLSYLDGRAFVNDKVSQTVLQSYAAMDSLQPGRMFTIMECSKENGGKIWPHRTHQNGMSIDFMVPMSANGAPFYSIDTIGYPHYLLDFEADGALDASPGTKIDFEVLAQHLLALKNAANENNLKITKVLLKGNLHDDLFASPSGSRLKAAGIYFPTKLEPLIDQLHDNHYHVDFGPR